MSQKMCGSVDVLSIRVSLVVSAAAFLFLLVYLRALQLRIMKVHRFEEKVASPG